uniref:Uncharacterized protein n=1 Tax=Octactis speculum TaxID=3111310 RepID=A0A7S2BV78_9STRA
MQVLGTGSYAEVRLARDLNTKSNLYAVKVINRSLNKGFGNKNRGGSTVEDMKREIAIMKKLNHPHVLKLYEVMDDPKVNKLYLVVEYMKGGDLMQMQEGDSRSFSCLCMTDTQIWRVLEQVALGLKYLHSQNIIHGDIKPQNILINKRPIESALVKIADFGISKTLTDGAELRKDESGGTPAFMSPELCEGKDGIDGRLADVWALGGTMYMLRFGKPPFVASKVIQLYYKITNEPVEFPDDEALGVGPELRDTLAGTLQKNCAKRLSIPQVLSKVRHRPNPSTTNHAKSSEPRRVGLHGSHGSPYTGPDRSLTSASPERADLTELIDVSSDEIFASVNSSIVTRPDESSDGDSVDSFDVKGRYMPLMTPVKEKDSGGLDRTVTSTPPSLVKDNSRHRQLDLGHWLEERGLGDYTVTLRHDFELVSTPQLFQLSDKDIDEIGASMKLGSRNMFKHEVLKLRSSHGSAPDHTIPSPAGQLTERLTETAQQRTRREELGNNNNNNSNTGNVVSGAAPPHNHNMGALHHTMNASEEATRAGRFQRKHSIEPTSRGSDAYRALNLNLVDTDEDDYDDDDASQASSASDESEDYLPVQTSSENGDGGGGGGLTRLDSEGFDSIMDTLAAQTPKPSEGSFTADEDLNLCLTNAFKSSTQLHSPALSLSISYHSVKGDREYQEDRVAVIPDLFAAVEVQDVYKVALSEDEEIAYLGLFDGHNGYMCSTLLQRRMHHALLLQPLFPESPEAALKLACTQMDKEVCQMVAQSEDESGSTGIMVLFDGTHLIVANVGDSRCVLSRGGHAIELSSEHRLTTRPDERKRVEQAGGTIISNRVNGTLAVSRSFGDVPHKGFTSGSEGSWKDVVIAVPETRQEALQKNDEFIVVATDGLWDVMHSQQVINFIRRRLSSHRNLVRMAKEVTAEALREKSVDNVSVIIVAFHQNKLEEDMSEGMMSTSSVAGGGGGGAS